MLNVEDFRKLRLMDHCSISFDVLGAGRVNMGGLDSNARVARNMDRLKEEGVAFGAITVLTKKNVHELDEIFTFFDRAALSCRFLPYYRESGKSQTAAYGISSIEKQNAMLRLIDLWMKRSSGIKLYPIEEYLAIALSIFSGSPRDLEVVTCYRAHQRHVVTWPKFAIAQGIVAQKSAFGERRAPM